MNTGLSVNASYLESPIAEYRGNLLIEALPPVLTEAQAARAIAQFPPVPGDERALDASLRLHCIDRLRVVVQPLPIHLELESAVSLLIRGGYVGRNPTQPSTVHHLHSMSSGAKVANGFRSTATTFSLTGLSGIGKSTALESILHLYPQTVQHRRYRGREFVQTQIVWLKLDTPFDGSLTGLCNAFFNAIDQAIGQTRYGGQNQGRSVSALINRMEQLASTYFIGLLLIDELQHLRTAKTGGRDNMLNFFVNLVNSIGIPVAFIGTSSMVELFSDVLRNARRATGLGLYDFCRPSPDDPAWSLLVDTLWRYQWLRHIEPLTTEMRALLYELTQGVTDLLVKLLILGQRYAIQSGEDRLSAGVLRHVADTKLQLLKPALAALRSGDPMRMAAFDDLLPPTEQIEAMMRSPAKPVDVLANLLGQSAIKTTAVPINLDNRASNEGLASAIPTGESKPSVAASLANSEKPLAALHAAGWLASDAMEFSPIYQPAPDNC